MTRSARTFTGSCAHKIAEKVLRRHFTLLAETGVRTFYCLGCGMNGCAFRAQDWSVLKVSTHPGEAPIARILAGKGRIWPFLPVFYGGWVVPGGELGSDGRIGLSWREDLIDFEPARRERRDYLAASRDLVDELKRARSVADVAAVKTEVMGRWVDAEFSAWSLEALEAIAGLAGWSRNYGLGFDLDEFSGSLAIQNLGQSLESDDAIVVRDIGNFNDSAAAIRRLAREVGSVKA